MELGLTKRRNLEASYILLVAAAGTDGTRVLAFAHFCRRSITGVTHVRFL